MPYKCKQFDHISKLAVEKRLDRDGFWNANKPTLKSDRERTNPNQLYTGPYGGTPDELELKIKEGEQPAQSDKFTDYTVNKLRLLLHLRILKDDFEPISDDTEYSLEITDPDWTQDSTGWTAPAKKEHPGIKKGVIKVKIPPTAQKGTLTVRIKAEDTDNSGGGGGGGKKANRGEVPVTWELKIGGLNPVCEKAPNVNCVSGVQQRLKNLRFYNPDPNVADVAITGIVDAKTRQAITEFRSSFMEATVADDKKGEPDKDMQEALKKAHDPVGRERLKPKRSG